LVDGYLLGDIDFFELVILKPEQQAGDPKAFIKLA